MVNAHEGRGSGVVNDGALRSEELYRTYAPQAFRRARRVLRSDADAHAAECADCRARVAISRVLLAA